MKKMLFRIMYIIVVIVFVGFFFQNSINESIETKIAKKIDVKINELRANGFNVTYNKAVKQTSEKPSKITAYGQLEIVDYPKALKYITQEQKSIQQVFKDQNVFIASYNEYKDFFEGMTFEYDLSVDPLSLSLDLEIYLVSFSNKIMKDLPSFIVDALNNRGFHIHIDENYNFKVKDINVSSINEGSFELIGMSGKIGEKYILDKLEIKEFNIKDQEWILSFKELYADENVFNLDSFIIKSESSFEKYKNVSFSFKDLKSVLSKEIKDGLLYFNVKTNLAFVSFQGTDELTNFGLNKASLEIVLDKFPIQKYEELVYSTYEENHIPKLKEFLEEISKNPSQIKININLEDSHSARENWQFNKVEYKLDTILSKNLASMKFENIYDLVQTLNINLKVDNNSAKNLETILLIPEGTLIDSEDKEFKLLKVELKEEGVFVNGTLALPKQMLQIPKTELK